MAGTDNLYDFDAPRMYCNLAELMMIPPDDSFFDVPERQNSISSNEKALRSSSKVSIGGPLNPAGVMKTPVELLVTQSTPIVENVEVTPAMGVNQEDKENAHYVTTKASEKDTMINSLSVGTSSSQMLAEIGKAMRRSIAARRSPGSSSASLGAGGAKLKNLFKAKSKLPCKPKLSGKLQLSEEDMQTLGSIATITNFPSSHLGPTVPHKFRFAAGSRLRQKAQPAKAPKKGLFKAVHHGPTRPQGERIKKHANSTNDGVALPFPLSLRSGSNTDLSYPSHRGPTILQPFNLTETRKCAEGEATKFVSVAEMNLAFHTKTPLRFRSWKKSGEPEEPHCSQKRMVTIPVTPNLASRARSRPVHHLTREEEERKELEEAQKYRFKARPVNKKIFEPPAEIREDKKLTVPEPLKITKTKKEERPLNVNRKEMFTLLGCSASVSLPGGGVPRVWSKSTTKIQPFSFDARDKSKMQRKQENILKVIEEEKKIPLFRSKPMLIIEEGVRGLPPKKPTPTLVQPFNLLSDERGEHKQELIQRKQEEKKAEEDAKIARLRQETVQKANHVRSYKPVVINPAPCLPTVPVSPKLATKARLRTRRGDCSANSTVDVSSVDSTVNLGSETFTTE